MSNRLTDDIRKGRGSPPFRWMGNRWFIMGNKALPLRGRQNCIGIRVLFQTEPPLFVACFAGSAKPGQYAGVFEFGKSSSNASFTNTCFAGDGFLGRVKSAGFVVEAIKNQ